MLCNSARLTGRESYEYIYEMDKLFYEIMHDVLLDKINIEEAEEPTTNNAIRQLGHYLIKLLNGLVKIIAFFISKIKALFRLFQIRSKDVLMGNKEFLSKYGARLEAASYMAVDIEGIQIANLGKSYGNEIGLLTSSNFNQLKMIVLDGLSAFPDQDSVDMQVSKNRHTILGDAYGNDFISEDVFKNRLHYKYYGDKKQRTYIVNDALNIIKNYASQYESIKRLSDLTNTNGNNDIRDIEQIKSLMYKSAGKSLNTNIIEQLNRLMAYRKKTLSDVMSTFNIILKYVDDSNLQAKAVCIKALQL